MSSVDARERSERGAQRIPRLCPLRYSGRRDGHNAFTAVAGVASCVHQTRISIRESLGEVEQHHWRSMHVVGSILLNQSCEDGNDVLGLETHARHETSLRTSSYLGRMRMSVGAELRSILHSVHSVGYSVDPDRQCEPLSMSSR